MWTSSRTIVRRQRQLALLAFASLAACSRNRTSDELRAQMRAPGDTSFMRYPCQSFTVDEFGWTLDSIDNVAFRVHPSLRRFGRRTLREVTYHSKNSRNSLVLELPLAYVDIVQAKRGLQGFRREECSVRDRSATVISGMSSFNFQTAIYWHDIGDGRSMLATATARTLEELRLLRGTLFTMRFPLTTREAPIR